MSVEPNRTVTGMLGSTISIKHYLTLPLQTIFRYHINLFAFNFHLTLPIIQREWI